MTLTAWAHARRCRGLLITYVALAVSAMLLNLLEPYVLGRIFNSVQQAASTKAILHAVFQNLGIFFALQVAFWMLHGPSRILERRVAFEIRTSYEMNLFRTITAHSVQWHKNHHSGESIDKIKRASSSLGSFCENSFGLIHHIVRFAGSLIMLVWFMPSVGMIVLPVTLLALFVIWLFDRRLVPQYDELNRLENFKASAVHDYITNIITVISLRLQDSVIAEVLRRRMLAWPVFSKNIVLNELKWFATTITVAMVITASLIWYCFTTLSRGQVIMTGTFYTLFEYLRRIGDTFYGFAAKYSEVVQQSADVRGAQTILDTLSPAEAHTHTPLLPDGWSCIEITNMNFAYEDEKQRLHYLRDIALTLRKGKSVALVGESGSGKSTLLSLIRGLNTPQKVYVSCDGKPLSNDLGCLWRYTTLIPQDPEIFADTVRFNVCFGVKAHDDAILKALKLARFEPVLARLPRGLDTNVAEKGVNLSGGERQRLGLARGIFFSGDAEIVLLDEPTSSVDSINEKVVFINLLKHFRDRTLVCSVHKLNLLQLFDEVCLFSNGQMVERGSFGELLDKQGCFAGLWRNYSEGILPWASEAGRLPKKDLF